MAFVIRFAIELEGGCDEFGRVTRAFVSGYNRNRVHVVRLFANETRCLVANFNGAIPKGATIKTVRWQIDRGGSIAISSAGIAVREAQVTLRAGRDGVTWVRCEATLQNGEVYNQLFEVFVAYAPSFGDDSFAPGPSSLVVSA